MNAEDLEPNAISAAIKQTIEQAIEQNMTLARKRYNVSGRAPRIVAVSKHQPVDAIQPFLERGHRLFGENRVQEAAEKWPQLREQFSGIELHLIGPLQTNKLSQALELFDVIETVDRRKLAEALAKARCTKPLYIQINTGEEPQKSGIFPKEADAFIRYCTQDLALNIKGLMCIPPANDAPSSHFALLNTIAKRHNLPELSMGMSGDYNEAAALGATQVRIGAALFKGLGIGVSDQPNNKTNK